MVEQSGEPLLLSFPYCFPHTVQPLGHALPALCRAHARLNDVLPRLCPSLPNLRKRLPSLVRLIATMGLVAAAFGRFPGPRIGLPPAAGAVTGLGILILILIVYELISIRRIHRSTMCAAPVVFAAVALAVPIGMPPAWHAFAALLNRTIGSHI